MSLSWPLLSLIAARLTLSPHYGAISQGDQPVSDGSRLIPLDSFSFEGGRNLSLLQLLSPLEMCLSAPSRVPPPVPPLEGKQCLTDQTRSHVPCLSSREAFHRNEGVTASAQYFSVQRQPFSKNEGVAYYRPSRGAFLETTE